MIVFLTDFGMTRDIYETDYYRKGGKGSSIWFGYSYPNRALYSISHAHFLKPHPHVPGPTLQSELHSTHASAAKSLPTRRNLCAQPLDILSHMRELQHNMVTSCHRYSTLCLRVTASMGSKNGEHFES